MAAEQPSLPVKTAYFEFPSIVVARLVKGPSASFLDKIKSVFDLEIYPKPTQNAPYRYELKGVVSDVELVLTLLKDVSHDATVLSEKEGLRDKQSVNIDHFKTIEQHLAIAVPGYASRRGEEKRMQRIAKQASDLTAEQMRRTFAVVSATSNPQGTSTPPVETVKPTTPPIKAAVLPKIGKLLANMSIFSPRNESQAILGAALNDPSTTLAFAIGAAGGGKSFVPLHHGFEKVRAGEKEKVILLRPRTTTGQRDLGPVGGDAQAKMRPYLSAQENNIIKITNQHIGELVKKNLLLLDTADLIRGDTFENAVVIVDEAQNFTKGVITAIATRLGENTQMIFTGDISSNQNDLGIKEPGLSYLLAHFISYANQNPAMAEALAVVSYASEDAAARSKTLPYILEALDKQPKGFAQIFDHAVRPMEKELVETIENNRNVALKLSEKYSIITENKYRQTAAQLYRAPDAGSIACLPMMRLATG